MPRHLFATGDSHKARICRCEQCRALREERPLPRDRHTAEMFPVVSVARDPRTPAKQRDLFDTPEEDNQ